MRRLNPTTRAVLYPILFLIGMLFAMWLGLYTIAHAATMRVSGITPDMGADSLCNTIPSEPLIGTMTVRIVWSGPQAGEDSLTALAPNVGFSKTFNVPSGFYVVTADARQPGSNWSCGVTLTKTVRGRTDKVKNLGDAMLRPRTLPGLLAAMVEP